MRLSENRYWVLFVTYLRPLKAKVALLAVLIFANIGLQIVAPQIIRLFIDTAVLPDGDSNLLLTYAVLFIVGAIGLQLVGVAATYVGEDVGWLATNQMRADVTRHCLNLDMTFHHKHTAGKMIERIDGDIADIAIFFAQFVLRIVGNALLLLGIIIVLLWLDWRISLALTVYACVVMLGFGLLRRLAIPAMKKVREANAELFGFLEEQLAGTEDTRSSGAVGYVLRRLYMLSRQRFAAEVKVANKMTYVLGTWSVLATLGRILSLLLGYFLFQGGMLTLGGVYLVIHYMNVILEPLRQIVRQIESFQKSAASIDRVHELMQEVSKIEQRAAAGLPEGALAVEFANVDFSYNGEDWVLQELSFELEPGEVLGVLGRTGSGKTTLTRLLFRFYEANHGAIYLGDGEDIAVPITQTRLTHLRERVGLVTQDVQLFQATVRDNLTFFDPNIPDEQILQVIDDLELSDWFQNLPKGLDTVLETEGTSLSAGEAQLLAFTRVFLKNPGLVILDEASSRLDPATERLIERAVDKLLAERTGIIVAHRLGTVERADKILIIENGRIHEFGRYEELANDPTSRFYQLRQTGLMEVLV